MGIRVPNFDLREVRHQFGCVEDDLSFCADEVDKIDVNKDSTRPGAVFWIASPTLPRNDIALQKND